MTARHAVTDEHKLAYLVREHELRDRFLKGVVNPDDTLKGIQALSEGKLSIPVVYSAKKQYEVLRPLKKVAEFPKTAEFRIIDQLRVTPRDERATAELVIGHISPNIENNFLANGGKVETDIFDYTLRPYRLKKDSRNDLIIADLGGEEAAETTFAEMVTLMRRQGRGKKGILLTNSYSNVFYIRDTKGVLWAVYCFWYLDDGSWGVGAVSVTDSYAWYAGDQAFRRDSDS